MGQFFGSFYCMLGLDELYGLDLANYLWGQASPYMTSNLFIPIGFTMLAVSLGIMLLYYYVIDHPKLCHFGGWLLFLIICMVLELFVRGLGTLVFFVGAYFYWMSH